MNCLATTSESVERDDWDKHLLQAQWAINSTRHKVTKLPPNEIIYNYRFRNFTNNPLVEEIELINDLFATEENCDVQKLLEENRRILKEQFDKKRKPVTIYKPKDLLVAKNKVSVFIKLS